MPFTASHPAIVLPLTFLPRRWYSLTGLVVGSMTPDFEYFLRLRLKTSYSHTVGGLFWFDLPLGLLLAIAFHVWVRNPLFTNLPKPLYTRFSYFKTFDWLEHLKSHWIVVAVSILVGSASHILWDSVTHARSPLVENFPTLATHIELFNTSIALTTLLQHGSTLIGGFFISYAIYRMPAGPWPGTAIDPKYWFLSAGIAGAIVMLRFLGGLTLSQYGNLVVTVIGAGLAGITVASLMLKRSSRAPGS